MTQRHEQQNRLNGRFSNWQPDACERSNAVNSCGHHCRAAKACAGSVFWLVLASGNFKVDMPSEENQLTWIHRGMMGLKVISQPRPGSLWRVDKGAVGVPHWERTLPEAEHQQTVEHFFSAHDPSRRLKLWWHLGPIR